MFFVLSLGPGTMTSDTRIGKLLYRKGDEKKVVGTSVTGVVQRWDYGDKEVVSTDFSWEFLGNRLMSVSKDSGL